MRYTMTGRCYLGNNAPTTSTACESDEEVLANIAGKSHSASSTSFPPTPPTSESLTSTSNDYEMDWERDTIDEPMKKECQKEVPSKAHRRKYGKPFVSFVPDLAEELYLSEDTIPGALDIIIPPKTSYKGSSNPFYSLKTKSSTKTEASSQPPSNGQLHNFPSQNSQVRIVRTIKRRLSARDIMAGPNVKRRKLNKNSNNFEVIDKSPHST